MATSRYNQFKKYVLFHEDFLFKISLYFIFNEQNVLGTIENDNLQFMLTYKQFKEYLIKLRDYAKRSCGIVCQSDKMCKGHQTLDIMQKYDDFMFDSVERRAVYYKYVKFFKVKKDDDPMFGYILIPIDEVDLGWDSWSKRMSYLLI